MHTQLKQIYFYFTLPAAIFFCAFFLAERSGLAPKGQFVLSPAWHSFLFIAAASAGIAGPVFIRTLFAYKVREQTFVPFEAFVKFQKRLIRVSMVTPYLALTAVVCELPKFHSAAIILMALYALYYHFPSAGRINFDRKIFKVK